MVEHNTTLEDFGVNCGKQRKLTAIQILVKIKPLIKILKDNIELPIGPNCIFSWNDYLKVPVYSSVHREYVEGSSNQLNDEAEEIVHRGYAQLQHRYPSGDTWLYHLKKLTIPQLCAMHDAITADIIKRAKRMGGINRKVWLAIDFTDILYYGQKDDPWVRRKKHDKGTCLCYRYATSNIVVAGQRYTLKAILVDKNTPTHIIVGKLVSHAKTLVGIDCVLLDRGFYSANVVSTLKKLGCSYIMPAPDNEKVKRELRIHEAPVVCRYRIGTGPNSTYSNLAIILREDGTKKGFFTNSDNPHGAIVLYARRWGIETSYSKIKRDFMAKTTSKNPIVRTFNFLLSVSLYNLWQLANLKMRPERIRRSRVFFRYTVKASAFGKKILRAIDAMDTGPPHSQVAYPLSS